MLESSGLCELACACPYKINYYLVMVYKLWLKHICTMVLIELGLAICFELRFVTKKLSSTDSQDSYIANYK